MSPVRVSWCRLPVACSWGSWCRTVLESLLRRGVAVDKCQGQASKTCAREEWAGFSGRGQLDWTRGQQGWLMPAKHERRWTNSGTYIKGLECLGSAYDRVRRCLFLVALHWFTQQWGNLVSSRTYSEKYPRFAGGPFYLLCSFLLLSLWLSSLLFLSLAA